jgi:hypothetical protein
MVRKIAYFISGLILLVVSFPLASKMITEQVYKIKINKHYHVANISMGYPATPSTYRFNDQVIEIKETIKDESRMIDAWDNTIALADLSIVLNGTIIDSLEDYPIRVEEEGLNRYYGEISYFILEDKELNKENFIVALKDTVEIVREKPNGDLDGLISREEIDYTVHTIGNNNDLVSNSFKYTERNGLQHKLLNAGYMIFIYRLI